MIGDPADGPLWTNVANSTEPVLGWFVLALFALLSILLLVNLLVRASAAGRIQLTWMHVLADTVQCRDDGLAPLAAMAAFWSAQIAMFGRTFEEISDDIDRQYMFVRANSVLGARPMPAQ